MRRELVLIVRRQTRPWRPLSSPCLPPARVNARKLVTYSLRLSRVTARPRGWKCLALAGSPQRPARMFTSPMIRSRATSSTVIVSCEELATKARLLSGETTTFHGSAPVVRRRTTPARKRAGRRSKMRMTATVPAAALVTNARRLSLLSATLCGSSPVRMRRISVFVSVRMTDTVSASGFTDQTKRPSSETAIGLEFEAGFRAVPTAAARAGAQLQSEKANAARQLLVIGEPHIAARSSCGREPKSRAADRTSLPVRQPGFR